MAVGVDRRPSGKEDGVLEHGLDSLPLEPSLFMQEKGSSHSCALRVPDDAVERAALLHNPHQILERIVSAPMRRCDTLSHQLSHGVLGRFTVGKLPNPRQDIILFGLFHVLVRFNEAEIRRLSEILLKPFWRDRFAGSVDEVKGCSRILGQLLDKGC